MKRYTAVILEILSVSLFTMVQSKLVEQTWTLRPRRAQAKDPSLSVDCNLNRLMMLVNDQYPGPTLEANVGDTIKVTLINESPADSMALHFHGLTMRGYPYVDGTSSVTQCASPPLQTQTYEFIAQDVGTHYWHGHVSYERADGMQGPIIIHNPDSDDEMELKQMYDKDVTVFLQDWYHEDGNYRRTGLDTSPFIWIGNAQSFLINGGGVYQPCLKHNGLSSCAADCSKENYLKTIEVEGGKTYRIRIIAGTELIGVNFAIQGHRMTVVEVEGALVEPYEIENLDIMPAQRYSVLVKADQDPGDYWATTAVRYRDSGPMGYIRFKYKDSPVTPVSILLEDDNSLPSHPAWNVTEPTTDLYSNLFTKNICFYDDADVLDAEETDIRRIIVVGTQANDEELGLLRWAMNNVTMTMGKEPIITSVYDAVNVKGSASWPELDVPGTVVVPDRPPTPWNYTERVQDSVGIYNGNRGPSYIPLTEGEVVEVVLQNARALNGVPEMHTWHLHGHQFYVVGSGFGSFDETVDTESYNLVNPVKRDTVTVLPLGWTAIRFKANNPGAWAFHCTQPSHAIMGMGFNFITSPDKLAPPPPAARSCLDNSLSSGLEEQELESSGSTRKGHKFNVADVASILGLLYFVG